MMRRTKMVAVEMEKGSSPMHRFVREARIERKWNVPASATLAKILEALRLVDDNGNVSKFVEETGEESVHYAYSAVP